MAQGPLAVAWIGHEFFAGVQCPVGIEQCLAAERDQVGVPCLQDVFGLLRFHDHSDRLRGNARFGPDALGERHLKAQASRHRE